MHPVILRIGSLEIRSWGVFVLTGFLVGIWLAAREAKRNGYSPDAVVDIGSFIVILAMIGSRIFYALYHPEQFAHNPLEIFAIWHGGLVFYGGVIFAIITAIIGAKIKRIPLWKLADWAAPGFAIGLAIGRWGCFFNGCCYGKPTNSVFGVSFKPGSPAFNEFGAMKLHPTQIYESVGNFLIFLLLLKIRRKYRLPDGVLFGIYMVLGPFVRFLDDFYRAYEPSTYVAFGLTINQFIAIALMLWGAGLIAVKMWKRQPATS